MKAHYLRSGVACLWAALAAAPAVRAQQAALPDKDAFELYGRAVQLMEATAVSAPELARAGAPITENARQAVITLRSLGRQHTGVTYTFVSNLRAYLALADAVPKPYPFPAEAAKQFVELRDDLLRAEANFRALLDLRETQLTNPDPDDLRRYAEANAKLGPPAADRPRVVFFGDSITDSWRLNEYFPDRDFVNRGISGQTTDQMLVRMMADVIAVKPEAMLILAGTNDLYKGMPPAATKNNLSAIAELAQAYRIKVLIASVLPVSDYHKDRNPAFEMTRTHPPGTIIELNNWIRNYCRERNFTYVDYYSAVVDRAGFFRADLSDDGLHPNSAGYRLMAPVALAAVDAVVAPAAGRRKGRK
jgi:lysophospholipase L1-like esterase